MLEVITVQISDIKPFEKNAKQHPKEQVEQIKSSITAFGMNDPIAIDENNVVIEGHGRLLALKELSYTEAPCIRLSHLNEEQKRAYILTHNKLTLNSGFDTDLLKSELEFLRGADFDVALTGFSDAEMADLFDEGKTATDDDYDPNPSVNPVSKQDDIWLLGKHKLICGDSTKAETYTALLGDEKSNLVVTDPPYNVAYEGTAGKIKNDNMADDKFHVFLLLAFKGMFASLTDGGSIYVFHADRESVNFRTAFKEAGFFCHQTCIWVKNSPVIGRCDYQYDIEPIIYGWKPTAGHKFYGGRSQRTTWHFDKPRKSEQHPTMKPLPLIGYAIANSSLENSIVLDPFGGSGSTLIACEQLNRICRTVELDEKFADVIVQRYIDHTGGGDGVFLLRDGVRIPYAEVKSDG